MTLADRTGRIQTHLGIKADTIYGPATATAIMAALGIPETTAPEPPRPPPSVFLGILAPAPPQPPPAVLSPGERVDDRSEKAIATLLPAVRPLARALIHNAAAVGIVAKVTSAHRTYAEQNALYEQGRTKPGKIVTNATGGFSNHNFGLAFDLTIFHGPDPVFESPKYAQLGDLGKLLGLTWGGDWTKPDEPHFELRPAWAKAMSEPQMLTALRARAAAGQDLLA